MPRCSFYRERLSSATSACGGCLCGTHSVPATSSSCLPSHPVRTDGVSVVSDRRLRRRPPLVGLLRPSSHDPLRRRSRHCAHRLGRPSIPPLMAVTPTTYPHRRSSACSRRRRPPSTASCRSHARRAGYAATARRDMTTQPLPRSWRCSTAGGSKSCRSRR